MIQIIAEIGANHMGNMSLATSMIDAAKRAGADTVKFQSWHPNALSKNFPDYTEVFKRHERTQLTDQNHYDLIDYCERENIKFLTSCFDISRIDFLAELNLSTIKVASPDCGSIKMIERLMKHFPKLIISTGMADQKTVLSSIEATRGHDVTYLHCVSLYPTPDYQVNLARMDWLKSQGVKVGFSDHSMGTNAAKIAISRGAEIVEKHFTLSRNLPGKDQAISMEPNEIQDICSFANSFTQMIGIEKPQLTDEERTLQSIYVGKWGKND